MTKEELQRLGNYLKKLRLQNKLSLRAVGDRLEVTHKAVQFWEQGTNEITLNNLVKLSRLYNVTLDEILEGSRI